jgi:glycosyltransferase involved in cell wall biosynthesis
LIFRDDFSQDATVEIAESMAREDERIQIITDDLGNQGAAGNFSVLLRYAKEMDAEYVCFADQDDVWQTWKLSRQMALMSEIEARRGRHLPALVHSDLRVVDERLRIVSRSFAAFQRIRHEESSPLLVLLVQNYVTGCTVMINRALLDFALPIPTSALMHDWWLALCAAACGQLAFLPDATVLYRQHGKNDVSAREFWGMLNPFRSDWRKRWQEGHAHFLQSFDQVRALRKRMFERGWQSNEPALRLVKRYLATWDNPRRPLQRILNIVRLGVHRQNILTQLLFLARVFSTPYANK